MTCQKKLQAGKWMGPANQGLCVSARARQLSNDTAVVLHAGHARQEPGSLGAGTCLWFQCPPPLLRTEGPGHESRQGRGGALEVSPQLARQRSFRGPRGGTGADRQLSLAPGPSEVHAQ